MDRPLDGLVLDLRGNTGDSLEALSSSLGLFLEGIYGTDQVRETRHRKRYETSGIGQGNSRVGVAMFMLPDGNDPGWYRQGIKPDWPVAGSCWDEIYSTHDPGLRKAVELLLN